MDEEEKNIHRFPMQSPSFSHWSQWEKSTGVRPKGINADKYPFRLQLYLFLNLNKENVFSVQFLPFYF